MKKDIVIAIVIALILGFSFGYGSGYTKGSYDTMVWGLKLAKNFITTIDFDEEMIATGIFNYENRVNNCFDIQDIK